MKRSTAISQAASEGAFEGTQAALQAQTDQKKQEEYNDPIFIEEETRLQKLLATIPKDGTSYIKIYKMLSNASDGKKSVFKREIMDLSNIIDLELTIRDMAIESDWGPGQYLVMPFLRDPVTGKQVHGVYATPVKFHIDYDKRIQKPQSLMGNLGEIKDVIETVRSISPERSSNSSMEDISKAITDTVKTTMDIVRNQKDGNGKDDLSKTLTTLKEFGVIKDEIKGDSRSVLKETLELLKEIGIIGQPKTDIITDIIKYREAGLLPAIQQGGGDVLSDVNKIKSLVELLAPLMNPPSEKPSMIVEVARIVGPQLPEVIKNLTEGIRDAKELVLGARAMKQGMQMNRQIPRPQVQQQPTQQAQEEDQAAQQPKGPTVSRDPIWIEIYNAVESRDNTFFPKLKGRLLFFVGPDQFDNIIEGTIPIDTLLELASTRGGTFLLTDETKMYLADFIVWEKKNQGTLIYANCDKCKEEFSFKSQQEWDEDSHKCECGGILKLVIEEKDGEGIEINIGSPIANTEHKEKAA